MFFNQLLSLLKGPDYPIWYGSVADLNNDKWTFQKLSSANVPDMDKWVQKVAKDMSLSSTKLKLQAISSTVPYKTMNTYSKSDIEKIFYGALNIDENKVRLLVRKTKIEIKKWIKKYVGDEMKDQSIARYIAKM